MAVGDDVSIANAPMRSPITNVATAMAAAKYSENKIEWI